MFLAFAKLITICVSLPLSKFYPYGVSNGDTELSANDDGESGEIRISRSPGLWAPGNSILFPYFDRNHDFLYVSTTVPTAQIVKIFDINC